MNSNTILLRLAIRLAVERHVCLPVASQWLSRGQTAVCVMRSPLKSAPNKLYNCYFVVAKQPKHRSSLILLPSWGGKRQIFFIKQTSATKFFFQTCCFQPILLLFIASHTNSFVVFLTADDISSLDCLFRVKNCYQSCFFIE